MTRTLSFLASAAAAAAFALAAPACAAPQASEPDSTTTTTETHNGDGQTVFVLTNRHRGPGQEPAGADGQNRVRIFKLMGANAADCTEKPLVDQASPDGHDRTKILICGQGELSAADRSAKLEHMMERVQHMDGLSDESKERLTAALREAIEQLHNAH